MKLDDFDEQFGYLKGSIHEQTGALGSGDRKTITTDTAIKFYIADKLREFGERLKEELHKEATQKVTPFLSSTEMKLIIDKELKEFL
jgi:hypothetical protein